MNHSPTVREFRHMSDAEILQHVDRDHLPGALVTERFEALSDKVDDLIEIVSRDIGGDVEDIDDLLAWAAAVARAIKVQRLSIPDNTTKRSIRK